MELHTWIMRSIPLLLVLPAVAWAESALSISGRAPASDEAITRPSAVRDAHAESPVAPSPEPDEARLTKNWGGARTRLSARGIDLAAIYKLEMNRVLGGGRARETAVLGNLDLRASLDFGKLAGTRGLTAFVYWLADHGGDPSAHVGDLQVSSNIETPVNTSRLYEAWVQQLGFDGRVSLLAGLHDLNSEFYVTESSGLFLNSSFGVGKELAQTGVNGPSIFPITAPALRLRVEASPEFYLMTAVFNARAGDPENPYGTHPRLSAADGRLWITEAGWSPGGFDPSQRIGKYAIGAWTYTRAVERVDGGEAAAVNDGAYFLIDQRLGGGVSAFARVGFASTEVNRVGSCLGVGVVAEGLVPGRARDRVGLALARAAAGGEFRDAQAAAGAPTLAAETALELDYRVEALPGIALQPSFQRIFDPGLDPATPDAWTGALRVELSF